MTEVGLVVHCAILIVSQATLFTEKGMACETMRYSDVVETCCKQFKDQQMLDYIVTCDTVMCESYLCT